MRDNIDQLFSVVEDLQKKLTAITEQKGQNDGIPNGDFIHRDELEKMKSAITEKFEAEIKSVSKASRLPKEIEEDEAKARMRGFKSFGDFILSIKKSSKGDFDERTRLKTAMTETTDAQGGYTVPEEWQSSVLGYLNNPATVVPKFTKLIQGTLTRHLPKWLTDLSVTWTGETTNKTATKPTLTTKTSTLNKLAAIVTFSDEYIEDDITDMTGLVTKLIGENMAVEFERVGITGDVTGLGDPFNGILYTAGTATQNQIGGNLSYTDLVNTWNNQNVLEKYRVGAEWTMNRKSLGLVMGIVDGNGRPLWNLQSINGRMVNTIFGDMINVSNTILNTYTLAGGTGESAIVYGNMGNVIMGERRGNRGISVNVTNQGIVSSGTSVSENLWQADETGYRFVKRASIVVANPEGFSVLQGVL